MKIKLKESIKVVITKEDDTKKAIFITVIYNLIQRTRTIDIKKVDSEDLYQVLDEVVKMGIINKSQMQTITYPK